jgi:lysophospholipase
LPARVQFQPQPVEDRLNWLIKHITSLQTSDQESPLQKVQKSDVENSKLHVNVSQTSSTIASSESNTLPQRPSDLGRLSTYQDVGVEFETSEMFQKEQDQAEQSLLPIALTAASAREDESLSSLLAICSDRIRMHGLLNLRTATGLGQTALHLAAFYGRLKNIELLLDHGASVHLRDDTGHTALFYAINNHHKSCVDLLVKAGAHLTDFEQAEDISTSFLCKSYSDIDLNSTEDVKIFVP